MEITRMNDDISKLFWTVPNNFHILYNDHVCHNDHNDHVFTCSANFWKYQRNLTIVDDSVTFAGIGGKCFL